jgi:hypothetical protein
MVDGRQQMPDETGSRDKFDILPRRAIRELPLQVVLSGGVGGYGAIGYSVCVTDYSKSIR